MKEEASLIPRQTETNPCFLAITSFSVTYDGLEKRITTHRARPPAGKDEKKKSEPRRLSAKRLYSSPIVVQKAQDLFYRNKYSSICVKQPMKLTK